jgi:hypothetical protein
LQYNETFQVRSPARRQIWLYAGFGIFVCVVLVGGFRSFFANVLTTGHPAVGMSYALFHALLMISWCGLFLSQVFMIRTGRVDLHRKSGLVGVALLAVIAITGYSVSVQSVRLGGVHVFAERGADFVYLLVFMFSFLVLAALGILFRKRPEFHKRFMLSSMIALLPAGLIRMPFPFLSVAFPLVLLALTDLTVIVAGAWDFIRNGRVHPAYGIALAMIVALQVLTLVIATSPLKDRLISLLAGG